MDIHRQFVMVAAVDGQQHILFDPVKVPLDTFQAWAELDFAQSNIADSAIALGSVDISA